MLAPQITGDPDFPEVTLKLSVEQSPNAPPGIVKFGIFYLSINNGKFLISIVKYGKKVKE